MCLGQTVNGNGKNRGVRVKNINIKRLKLPVIIFSLLLIILSGLFGYLYSLYIERQEKEMEYYAKNMGDEIESTLIMRMNISRTMETYLRFTNGDASGFEKIADELKVLPYIDSIFFAPDNIISNIYSENDYSHLIGKNAEDEMFGGALVSKNFDDFNFYLSGPMEIADGRQVLIGRMPVNIKCSDGTFLKWGVVGLSFDYPEILESVDSSLITEKNYCISVWKKGSEDEERFELVQYGKEAVSDDSDHVRYEKNLLNTTWYVDVAVASQVSEVLVLLSLLSVSILISFIVAFWLYKYLCKRDKRYFERQAEYDRQYFGVMTLLSSEYSSVYYVFLDSDTVIPYGMSNRITEMFGDSFKKMKYSDAVASYIEKAVIEEDREKVKTYLDINWVKEQLKTQSSFIKYYLNNENRYCEYKCVRVEDQFGKNIAVMGFAEKDLQIRTEMEYQEQLKAARQKAEAASVAKSTFLFNMSHDIRTPMNAIIGYTQMAQKHINDIDMVRDCLDKVNVSGDLLRRLINDILDVARIENGKLAINETVVDIKELIDEIHTIVVEGIAEKKITLKNVFDLKYRYIYVDRLRVSQIALNIISNATKFTPENGKVSCSLVQTEMDAEGYSMITLTVEDTGCGMSKEFAEHIFEAFVRERSSTTSGIQGTGLGMAITKALIDKMGGTIDISSTEGVGTTVTVNIRCRVSGNAGGSRLFEEHVTTGKEFADMSGELFNAINKAGTEIEEIDLHGRRVLIVEDNKLNIEITECILKDEGIITETAVNGKLAYEMVKNNPPEYYNLVLMDIQMPVMDGYEATRRIRSLEDDGYRELPIVAMSANADDNSMKLGEEYGMDGYISKPIRLEEMMETIKEYIR